jgi:hypothetical protein
VSEVGEEEPGATLPDGLACRVALGDPPLSADSLAWRPREVEHGLGDLLAGGAPARQGRVGRHDEGHPAFAHGHLGQGGRGGDRAASVDDHGGQPRVAGVDAQRSVAANPSHVTHEVDHLESNPVEREPVDGERAMVEGRR